MLWSNNCQVRQCTENKGHLAATLRLVTPEANLAFLTSEAPRVRRAHTLSRFRVTRVLSVSTVTGWNRDTWFHYTSGMAAGVERVRADVTSYLPVTNNLNHSLCSWGDLRIPKTPRVCWGVTAPPCQEMLLEDRRWGASRRNEKRVEKTSTEDPGS